MFRKLLTTVLTFSFLLVLTSCGASQKAAYATMGDSPKHEFRGAWIQTVWQSRYQQMNSAAMKHYLREMVRKLDEAGINAVIFQIRPEADAFYKSSLEPWSRFMTGEQGKAPDDSNFDPLEFLADECHSRGMELHAWLNPYRVKSSLASQLAPNHLYWREPDRFVEYGNQLLFDPGMPENREFITRVVRDIVSRYEVDAIHMDDYFYPYPIAGTPFPDDRSFARYAAQQGFSSHQRDDWRRNNVNLLIQEIKQTIVLTKPWVRFGISPFGIYRNKRNDPKGSDTNGLQNYDDLYADVKLWTEKGWIDYNMPQLYWEIGHSAADYSTLLKWWSENNFGEHLYIGQDIKRSMDKNELNTKIKQTRSTPAVHGSSYWYGYQILENESGVTNELKSNIHRNKALVPAYSNMHSGRPAKVKKLTQVFTEDMHFLTWEHNKDAQNPETSQKFVVYRFGKNDKVDIRKAQNIVAVTAENFFVLPYEGGRTRYTYVVTSLDAFNNEGKAVRIKVKL